MTDVKNLFPQCDILSRSASLKIYLENPYIMAINWPLRQAGVRYQSGYIPRSGYNKMHFFFTKSWKFLDDKQEAQRATYRAPEYNVPPLREIKHGGPFCLLISLKNTNFAEDVEILLPVKLR